MSKRVLPNEVMSVSETAIWAGVSKVTARTWVYRYDDHPKPWRAGPLGEPNLYLVAEMEAFCRGHGLGRFAAPKKAKSAA